MQEDDFMEQEDYGEKFERLRQDFEQFRREHYDKLLKLYVQLRRVSLSLKDEYASLSNKHETLVNLLINRAKDVIELLEEAKEKSNLEGITRYGLIEEELNILFRAYRLLQHDYLGENNPQKREEFEKQLESLGKDDPRAAEVVRRHLKEKEQDSRVTKDTGRYLMNPRIKAYFESLKRPPTQAEIGQLTDDIIKGKMDAEQEEDDMPHPDLEEEAEKARTYMDQRDPIDPDNPPEEELEVTDEDADEEIAYEETERIRAEKSKYKKKRSKKSEIDKPIGDNEILDFKRHLRDGNLDEEIRKLMGYR